MTRKAGATRTFLFLEAAMALAFGLAFTAMSLYEVRVAGLSPLQLVLVGTTLEAACFLFEIPTGVVADVYSRRLSVIIGVGLIGLGFLLEGSLALFGTILLAQVIWGLGYTFISGAAQAWLSDEIGEENANRTFLRGNRYSLGGSLAGMLLAILIGGRTVRLPILAGGAVFLLLALALSLKMPETGFHPAPREQRNSFHQMVGIFRDGLQAVRQSPRLGIILWIGLFYGLYSEGFDRLWIKLMVGRFSLPKIPGLGEIAWFGGIQMVGMLLSIFATRLVEKRLDAGRPAAVTRLMFGITAGLAAGLFAYALSPWLALTVAVCWLIGVLRSLSDPLYTAWVNQRLDPAVRATVLSMSSQVNALGQIISGPAVGLVANLLSVQAAIAVSGALLTPALALTGRLGGHPVSPAGS